MYLKELKGTLKINGQGTWSSPKNPKELYIITTAKKRDSHEWESELIPFGLKVGDNKGVKVIIDSWNNVKKYSKVYCQLFIFDEQKSVGRGTWSKSFIKIAKHNHWIMLTATPGDNYTDLIPLFIANGYFKNRTEFNTYHVVFKPYMKFPCIDHYVNTGILNKYKREMFVLMDSPRHIKKESQIIRCEYNKDIYKTIWRKRWDPYGNCPIEETGKLCYLLRRVTNEDRSRINHVIDILREHSKAIIFYNFTPELELLRKLCSDNDIVESEWNGERHEELPSGDKWVYLCQYTAAAEGWNAITTDTMIFYSLSYSYKTMVQAAGRIDRSNSPFDILYYYYLTSYAPIDLAIQKALHEKRNFNERSFV